MRRESAVLRSHRRGEFSTYGGGLPQAGSGGLAIQCGRPPPSSTAIWIGGVMSRPAAHTPAQTPARTAANVKHVAISADDLPRARRFYERVFGWQFKPWGPPGFLLITTGTDEEPGILGALQGR